MATKSENPAALSTGLHPITREPWWRSPALRLRLALLTSFIGIAGALGAALIRLLSPTAATAGSTVYAKTEAMVGAALSASALLFGLTSGLLGLYLAYRSTRHTLVAQLAFSCGCASASTGLFMTILSPVPSQLLSKNSGSRETMISTMLNTSAPGLSATLFILSIVLLLTALFAFGNFYANFPRQVVLHALEQNDPAPSTGFANKLLATWKGYLVGLAVPISLVALYSLPAVVAPALLDSTIVSDAIQRLVLFGGICFIPFVLSYARRAHLPPAEQAIINWLLLGQSIVVFIFIVLAFAVLAWWIASGWSPQEKHGGWSPYRGWTPYFLLISNTFSMVFHTVSLAMISYAILYRGTLDPSLTVRRTWIVGITVLIASLLFVLLERLAAGWLVRQLGMQSETALLLVGGLVAASFFPIRAWTETRIKALFDRYLSPENFTQGPRVTAAIVFSDLSGYSALAAQNEPEAILAASLFHRSARLLATEYEGRVIKTIGDAIMLSFPQPAQALQATRAIHADYLEKARSLLDIPLLPHAGIHIGDVVQTDDGDLLGSAVNIAARLQGQARQGEIVISQAIKEAVPDTDVQPLGPLSLKNIPHSIDAFAMPG